MISINNSLSITYNEGYYLLHEHYVNDKGEEKVKAATTYANPHSLSYHLGKEYNTVMSEKELLPFCTNAVREDGIKSALKAKKASERFKDGGGF